MNESWKTKPIKSSDFIIKIKFLRTENRGTIQNTPYLTNIYPKRKEQGKNMYLIIFKKIEGILPELKKIVRIKRLTSN